MFFRGTLPKSPVILPTLLFCGQDAVVIGSIPIGPRLRSRWMPGVGSVSSLDAFPEVPPLSCGTELRNAREKGSCRQTSAWHAPQRGCRSRVAACFRQAVPRGLGTLRKNRPKGRCGVLYPGGTLAPRSADLESLTGKLPSSAPKHPSFTPPPPLNSGEHETRQVCVRMHCATAVPCCATYGCVFFVTRVMAAASEGVGGARGISSLLHIYTGADADHDYAMMIMHSIFWPLYLRLADGCPYERRAVVSEVGVSVFSRERLEKQ